MSESLFDRGDFAQHEGVTQLEAATHIPQSITREQTTRLIISFDSLDDRDQFVERLAPSDLRYVTAVWSCTWPPGSEAAMRLDV